MTQPTDVKTATKIGPAPRMRGNAILYKVDPPMCDYDGTEFSYVVVSAVVVPFGGPETYIFGADEHGGITCWGELEGSFKGDLDHERALAGAGYEVVAEGGRA